MAFDEFANRGIRCTSEVHRHLETRRLDSTCEPWPTTGAAPHPNSTSIVTASPLFTSIGSIVTPPSPGSSRTRCWTNEKVFRRFNAIYEAPLVTWINRMEVRLERQLNLTVTTRKDPIRSFVKYFLIFVFFVVS